MRFITWFPLKESHPRITTCLNRLGQTREKVLRGRRLADYASVVKGTLTQCDDGVSRFARCKRQVDCDRPCSHSIKPRAEHASPAPNPWKSLILLFLKTHHERLRPCWCRSKVDNRVRPVWIATDRPLALDPLRRSVGGSPPGRSRTDPDTLRIASCRLPHGPSTGNGF